MTDATSYWTYSPQLAAQQYAQQQQLKQREAERAAERERAKQTRLEEFMMRFGEDAVVGPDGNIDILGSTQKRALSDEAERVGRVEGVMQASIPEVNPELRNLPAFRRGMAAGMAERQLQDFNLDRQLSVEAARGNARLGVAERQAESREHLANLGRWDDIVRAFGAQGRKAQGETVTLTSKIPGVGDVTEKLTQEEYEARKRASAVEIVDRFNAELSDLENGIRASTEENWEVGFDPVTGQFSAKPAGWFGGVSKNEAIARLNAARKTVPGIARNIVNQAAKGASEEAARFLEGVNPPVSVKPTAAPSVGRVPMDNRQTDAVVRGAVNPQPGAGPQYFYDAKTGRVVLMQPRQQ